MKVIEYTRYGPPEVLHFKEIRKPVPRKNEILVKVLATTVTSGDIKMRMANPFAVRLINGLGKPLFIKVLGLEYAGEVAGVGTGVKNFKIGDGVFGGRGLRMGAYAQYIRVHGSRGVAKKVSTVSFEEAAALPIGGCTAMYYLTEKAAIKAGNKVMIYGASGSVGSYAVQLAKYLGAVVTAVCGPANFDLVKSLGADEVVDYSGNFIPEGVHFDCIFDAVGKSSRSQVVKGLSSQGKYVTVNKGLARIRTGNLEFLMNLVAGGKLKVVIDKQYEWERMTEAHRYVDNGHKKGNVIVSVKN